MGNSVIYRPAYDAEVEYLESTGTQYIDTGIVPTENTRVVAKLYTEQDVNTNLFGSQVFSANNYEGYALNYNINGVIDYIFGNSGWRTVSASYSLLNRVFEIDYSNVALKVDEVTLTTSLCSEFPTLTKSMLIFWRTGTPESSKTAGRVYYFKIYSGSTLVRDFIPVRIGQVGYLYDKVTKQLFANKGTGNFILGNDVSNAVIPQQRCVLYFGNQRSVIYERIYEEYEWLISNSEGNITPNIDTLVIPNAGQELSFIFKVIDSTTNGNEAGVFSATNITEWKQRVVRCYKHNSYNHIILEYNNNNNDYPAHTDMCIFDDLVIGNEYNCSLTIDSATAAVGVINDTSKNLVPNGSVKLGRGSSYDLFRQSHNASWSFKSVGFRKFKISGVIDLIPCKLLQPIPAILDGNGIARQAGECGMWDKVSNRFYGNVASSGTFTVKGPKCYEEYDWLEVEIPPKCYTCNLPINSENFSYSRKYTQIGNTTHLIASNNYMYFSADLIGVGIWDGTQTINYRSMSINNLEIACTSDKLLINSIEFPKYGIPVTLSLYNVSGSVTTLCKQSKVIIDNAVCYVPCKLTHGIPASMDANGIARPAGTCGMWDKVNDKFYGNVASKGSFTVSND